MACFRERNRSRRLLRRLGLAGVLVAALSAVTPPPGDVQATALRRTSPVPEVDRVEDHTGRHWNTKKFANPDGSSTYLVSSGPLHYRDGDTWQEIDTAIVPSDRAGSDFEMTRSMYKAFFRKRFDRGPIVRLQKDGHELSVTPGSLYWTNDAGTRQLIAKPQQAAGQVAANRITYADAYGAGLDFVYETVDIKLGKQLRVPQFSALPAPASGVRSGENPALALDFGLEVHDDIDIYIDGYVWDGEPRSFSNGQLEFKNDDELLWFLAPPRAWDDSQQQTSGTARITRDGGRLNLTVTFPLSWLEQTTGTIILDPDTYYGQTTDGYIYGKNTVYATAHATSDVIDTAAKHVTVGQLFSTGNRIHVNRAFLEFDTSAIVGDVSQARLFLMCRNDQSSAEFTVRIHKYNWTSPISAGNQEANYDGALASTYDANWRSSVGIAQDVYYASQNLDTSWVDTAGTTRYVLLSDKDVSATAPGTGESMQIYSQDENVSTKRPYLEITAVTAPDAPTALGPASFVDGSCNTDTTPTLQFTQSDPVPADTLAFQIQIDNDSDFSSAVVDYQSAAVAQGATSFTVGQAAGGGTYNVGSEGQTLATGMYFWRVRSYDASEWGPWTEANGGSVAFDLGGTCSTVGPTGASECGGSGCDYQSVQAAIDAASSGDVITLYRRTDDANNNECYNEHITVNKANLTIQGDSTTPANATCIAPSTGGDIVTITASGVTLRDLEISGKTNDGSGGTNSKGSGGRASGYGIYISGNDVDGVVIDNCTVSFSYSDLIRWDGDQDNDNNGNVTIRNCYLHHSDLPKHNIRIIGGSNSSETHVVENCLMTTAQGILSDAEYITVRKNVINGWPYWGHMVSDGTWPETHDYNAQSANFGGGWRYFSRMSAGIHVQNGGAGTGINVSNNLVVGARIGIRVQTTGTVSNNTVVNPYNPENGYTNAANVRDATYGIMVVSGFSGTLSNNIVVVTEDNRANGQPAQASAPKYTTGITGYGIGFSGGTGSLAGGAAVLNNNVWGFVDTDGTTATNWGSGLSTCEDNSASQCKDNISKDPGFASDTSDESNGGSSPCDADSANSRCYELYHDNFFLKSIRTLGSCHADIRDNTAGYVGFVNLNSSSDVAALEDCSSAADSGASSELLDWGNGAVSNEPGTNGSAPNLGAFGNTDRASQSDTLRITGITVGDGGVKNGDSSYSGPGLIQPRSDGLTEVSITFNRAVSAVAGNFQVRDRCDASDLTAPTLDTTEQSSPPFKVKLTWPASTFDDQWVRIHVLGDGANRLTDLAGKALDGEFSNIETGTVPSGDGIDGGDAEFIVAALAGDVDGDQAVEGQSGEHDYDAVTGYAGYPAGSCSACPEDLDADGDVDAADLAVVTGNDNDTFGWYDTNWSYRKQITISDSEVGGDLVNFPVLINTTDADWKSTGNGGNVGQTDGGDILFVDDCLNKLDHEVEKYDPATGELVAWVELAGVSETADTTFHIYYGNAGAADQWNVSGTWDANHVGVWHLSEDPGDVLEFDTSVAAAPSITQVSGDIYAIAYGGPDGDGWLATVDINSDGSIDNAVIDTLEFDTADCSDPDIIHVSGDVYVIAYQGGNGDGWLATVDINTDGSIDNAVIATLEYDTFNGGKPTIIPVSGDIFAIAYLSSGSDGGIVTVDIDPSGTPISVVDTLTYDNSNSVNDPDIVAVSGDIYAVVSEGAGSDGFLHTIDVDPSGTPLSVVDSLEFDTDSGQQPTMVPVSGDIYAIAYNGTTGDGFVKTVDIDATGTPLSVVDTLEFNTSDCRNPRILNISGDFFAVVYEGPVHPNALDFSGHITTLDIDATGTPLSVVDDVDFDELRGITPSVVNVSGDVYGIAHSGLDGDGFVRTIDITSSGLLGEFRDSTSNDSCAAGIAARATGQMGSAQDFDGSDDRLLLSSAGEDTQLDLTGALTVSAWFYPDNLDSILLDNRYQQIPAQSGYLLQTDASGQVVFAGGDGTNAAAAGIAVSTATITVSQWNHIAAVKASGSSTITFYVNGTTAGTDTINSATIAYNATHVRRVIGTSDDNDPYGGSNGFGSKQFTDGRIDELRVSNTDRSADWIQTSYNNQNSPSTFYTVGAEETP